MSFNDVAWEKLFSELKITESLLVEPSFLISAKQINHIGKREARLMAKFDTRESLPQIFKDQKLNINATSNGMYLIFKDNYHRSFITLPDYKSIVPKKVYPDVDFPLDTLSFSNKMSESNAIDYAHHSKILSLYSGEKELKLTTRGRFFSDSFDFHIDGVGEINVKGVQVEVDAGYEGTEQFLILEAKSSTRSNFNIRQLYYPYRHFRKKTGKNIRTILLSFSNGIYYFTEIALSNNYYDYKIINTEAIEVVIEEKQKNISIGQLLGQQTITPERIPVPQADDINKVIDLAFYLIDNPANKFQIADHFEIDERQGDYYGNAASYIGLAEKVADKFQLTDSGNSIATIKNRDTRNIEVIKLILQTKLFNDLMCVFLSKDRKITNDEVIKRIMSEGLNITTARRRSSTIISWINWMNSNLT